MEPADFRKNEFELGYEGQERHGWAEWPAESQMQEWHMKMRGREQAGFVLEAKKSPTS